MKLYCTYCTGIFLSTLIGFTTVWPCSAEVASEKQTTAVDVASPVLTAQAPPVQLVTTPSLVTTAPDTDASSAATPPLVPLSGYLKQHKHHLLLSILKQEFNSPIHTITTNNRDY
jgi:hypothetical protein